MGNWGKEDLLLIIAVERGFTVWIGVQQSNMGIGNMTFQKEVKVWGEKL